MNQIEDASLEIIDLNLQIKQRQEKLQTIKKLNEKKQLEIEIKELQQKLATAWEIYNHEEEIEKQYEKIESIRQEYRSFHASAKKPVYKHFSYQCPHCMGYREIQEDKDIIVCPYCDSIEPLIVDHYTVDYDKVQEQYDKKHNQQKQAFWKYVSDRYILTITIFIVTLLLSVLLIFLFHPF